MKGAEKSVMRLAAVQQLRAVYGIKTKNWNKNKGASWKPAASSSTKVFGVPLESLPYYNMQSGSVPSFLVDACMRLLAHVDTEGLFRKSGSVVRLKALRAKLDAEEECLSTALPCDVAGLVKQFFRELPEPVVPAELHEAFLKAQQLPSEEERTSATMLLSCVLPDRNLSVLRYFLEFLHNVSQRSAENKMDSSNLSVILAPNLLHSGDATEKMNANTERRLRHQAAVVHCFIENAEQFGVLPQHLQERVPAMMGCEAGTVSPSRHELEELDLNSGLKRKQRRSLGDVVSGALSKMKANRTPTNAGQADSLVFASATPVIATPSSKRKLPLESGHSFGFSNKKRRSVKKTLGIDLLPNILLSGTSTPGSAFSASGVLDASSNTLSSAGKSRQPSAASSRRKSCRLSSRHAVSRVESGKAGCFSPKVNKKEAPRKSLRLRLSVGRSSKDAGSESIGLRLATQESAASLPFGKEADFSPPVARRKADPQSSKYMSKSEENLLTPQYDPSAHRTSWSGETPVGGPAFSGGSFTDTPMSVCLKSSYASEPAIAASKPPAGGGGLPIKLCCATSSGSLESGAQTGPSPQTLESAFVQDVGTQAEGSAAPPEDVPVEASRLPAQQEQNVPLGQTAALSPLHIDSVVFDTEPDFTEEANGCLCAADSSGENSLGEQSEGEAQPANCSRLVDALDIHSPALFTCGVSSGLQSTPFRPKLQLPEFVTPPKGDAELPEEFVTPPRGCAEESAAPRSCNKVQGQQPPRGRESEQRRVAEHIRHFNKLTLQSPKASCARSPLKFHRTPVRQTVRRINSLLGDGRRPARAVDPQVTKAVSLESGLSPRPQRQTPAAPAARSKKKPPPVPPKKPSTLSRRASALGDVTNKVQAKTKAEGPGAEASGAVRPLVQDKDMSHYRGSPRNPLNQARLLSATKPVDL